MEKEYNRRHGGSSMRRSGGTIMNTTIRNGFASDDDRSRWLLFAGALILGGLHQLLFYGVVPGISVPIFLLLLNGYFYIFARDRLRSLDSAGLLLTGASLLLALTYALFDNPVFFTLNLLALPSLVAWQFTYLLSDRRRSWHDPRLIPDALGHVLYQTVVNVPQIWTPFRRSKKVEDEEDGPDHTAGKQILYGLLFAAPVLVIVCILLLSADGVLRAMLGQIPDWFGQLSLGSAPTRLIWAVGIGGFFLTYLLGFRTPRRVPPVQGPAMAEPIEPMRYLPTLMTITLMTTINLVYVLFVALQFSYLFGAWQGVLPQSSTYAEYTHSGFGELIGVTLINFLLLLVGLYATDPGQGKARTTLHALLGLLVFCSAAMLGSAFSRLLLYEEAYGYTRLRFLVHAFMIFLFLLLLLFALCIRFRRLPLGRWMIVLGVCAYLAVNYACMDRVITVLNLERQEADEEPADLYYLMSLSSDAVPVLIQYGRAQGGELDLLLREKVQQDDALSAAWQSWNVSDWRANQLLKEYGAHPIE
ncbi:hypothetical protein B9G55_08760 [Saccharibacillus sp. O16]|nr:hypothetical protein B9G55_08760 [Saccharibacillus sp. O16]